MKVFLTEYKVGDSSYASEIWTSTLEEAEALVIERGLEEKIIGHNDFNQCIDKEKLYTLLHSICFLSYIALKSKKATVEEILSDKGVLHEAIHLLDGSFNDDTLKQFNKKLNWIYEVTNSTPLVAIPMSILNTGSPR